VIALADERGQNPVRALRVRRGAFRNQAP
jgi:hypothetical protein